MRINLLGPLEIFGADDRPVDVGGPRVRALAARLALANGRTVAAELLIDDLWGADPPAASALHRLVSRLRAALARAGASHALLSKPGGYRFDASEVDVDARRFEELAAAGHRALSEADPAAAARLLSQAERLWRGPALSGLGEAPFVTGAAARLADLRVLAAENRFAAALTLGRHAAVAAEIEQLAAAHPLRERLQGLLMRAQYATGRQSEALATYERVRAELADRLGADPSPELAAVHLAVLRQNLDLPPQPPRRAPSPIALTSFVGRESEISELRRLLGRQRLVTILGPGGAGKTRLARELLAQLPDGGEARFVELSMIDSPAGLVPAILETLGGRTVFPGGPVATAGSAADPAPAGRPGDTDPPSAPPDDPTPSNRLGGTDPYSAPPDEFAPANRLGGTSPSYAPPDELAGLAEVLNGRELVLVFDNCEHVLADVGPLAERLLGTHSGLRILCTSRQPLGIAGEQRYPLPPLSLPSADRPASEAAAVRLFADRAANARPDFTITDANVEAVAEICRRLDGLPLAIELAAARTRVLTPAQLASRLDHRFRLLTGGSRTAEARHQTLRAVVDWSWELLDEPERLLAQRFSVFTGGASLAAVEAVCGGRDLPRERVLDLVTALVDKSLLDSVDDSAEPRFRMLDTIREFASERLAAADEAATRTAHARFHLHLAEEAEPRLRGAGQLAAVAMFQAEQPNLLSALRHALSTTDTELALRLAVAQVWYRLLRGARYDPAIAEGVLDLPGDDFATERATVATALAMASFGFAGVDLAVGRRAVAVARRHIGRADRRRHPLLSLWEPLLALRDKDLPRTRHELERLLSATDEWTRATALLFLGFVHNLDGAPATARRHLERAAGHFRRLGDHWGLFLTAQALAPIRSLAGNPAAAADTYREALTHLEALGTGEDVPMLLTQVGHELLRANDTEAARLELESASLLAERHGNRDAAIWAHCGLGDLAEATGDRAGAMRHYRLARDAIPPDSPSQRLIPVIESRIAAVQFRDGHTDDAMARLRVAVTAAITAADPSGLALAASTLAGFALADGDPGGAAEILGLADTIRGTPDHGDPGSKRTGDAARAALGDSGFAAAHRHGSRLPRADALRRLTDLVG